jgi:hypothetical protein
MDFTELVIIFKTEKNLRLIIVVWCRDESENLEICLFHTGWVLFYSKLLIEEPWCVEHSSNWLSNEIKTTFYWPSHKASNTLKNS